ncbi:serine/threonine protein phosphatase [Thiocapsa imhoffii]|uniref:Serine/threonine protein phosphatase n=1 Tax=Thiocapsa imhoffii TaxID=382777 RepID=A0A9X0WL03_9GAMM|nr:protein phosphatase 2C domain-containing protein [Thiocapsa imhoffii]MBK1646681.1 serine/threonine protein phosphatase [Thiocapsa imhoffii]
MTRCDFISATLCKAGARANNEDAYGVREDDDGGVWVVADGLGGHGGGEVAARIAVETLLGALDPGAGLGSVDLMAVLTDAAGAIRARQRAEPALSGMRTTVVVLASDGEHALWAHLGDSRLYWFRAGRILVQTEDHSVPQALVRAGELAPEAVRFHEDRNRLLRTLGDEKPLRPGIPEAPLALVDGDACLLCSDGFWESVTEAEMEVSLAKAGDPGQWLTLMEKCLRGRTHPGQDNYTALAIWFERSDAAP